MALATHHRRHVEVKDYDDDALQKSRFGGLHWGAAFYGWLVAMALGVLLTAILAATGITLTLNSVQDSGVGATVNNIGDSLSTIGAMGGILLLISLAIAYYAGGYVAGRLSRFDGALQGFGAWLVGIVIAILLAILGTSLGAEYNLFQQFNLPHIPVDGQSLTTTGLVTSLLVLAVTLGSAIAGGAAGERYHRTIDDASHENNTTTRDVTEDTDNRR